MITGAWESWLEDRSQLRRARGTERSDPVLRQGAGSAGGAVLDLASNDYLGLSQDGRVVAAAHAALDRYGASATASRLVTGTLPVHRELEASLCRLTGQPSALAFSTGYAANLGVITALAGQGAEILLDAHAHASLHDAARMSRVPYATFAHSDPADLDRELARRPEARVIVAVESIYSVLGDAAPCPSSSRCASATGRCSSSTRPTASASRVRAAGSWPPSASSALRTSSSR